MNKFREIMSAERYRQLAQAYIERDIAESRSAPERPAHYAIAMRLMPMEAALRKTAWLGEGHVKYVTRMESRQGRGRK